MNPFGPPKDSVLEFALVSDQSKKIAFGFQPTGSASLSMAFAPGNAELTCIKNDLFLVRKNIPARLKLLGGAVSISLDSMLSQQLNTGMATEIRAFLNAVWTDKQLKALLVAA